MQCPALCRHIKLQAIISCVQLRVTPHNRHILIIETYTPNALKTSFFGCTHKTVVAHSQESRHPESWSQREFMRQFTPSLPSRFNCLLATEWRGACTRLCVCVNACAVFEYHVRRRRCDAQSQTHRKHGPRHIHTAGTRSSCARVHAPESN